MNTTQFSADDQKWLDKLERIKPDIAARARSLDEAGGWPEASLQILSDEGFHKLAIPREFGGEGTEKTWCSALVSQIIENVASVCGSTGWAMLSHYHSSGLVASLGDDEQRHRILGDVIENGARIASVGSEVRPWQPNSAGQADGKLSFESDFRPVDGGFIANGIKGFSSMGAASKYLLYWAAAPGLESDPSTGVVVSVIESSDPGVSPLAGWEEAIGIRSSLSGGMKFENVFVPWSNVLGEPGDAYQSHPFLFEITYAAELLGLAKGAYDVVRKTLIERPFLRGDQTIIYAFGEMAAKIQATTASRMVAQQLWDSGDYDRAGHATLLALHEAKETAMWVCTKAFEAVGTRGLFKWNPLERLWRDARTVTLHTRESLIMQVAANAELNEDYFAKAKYGHRIPPENRVTWASLGMRRAAAV
ncbi:butyryl-CoA dehydrogenase (plasmid) [Arthrobacter sp. StoSoilB3]|nr:butyryl-CoA dehydrogenase [Arthrobacter sp. StoSoilB3]